MPIALRLLGAFVVTFFLSRLIGKATGGLSGGAKIVLVHLCSFAILAIVVGLMKAHFNTFTWEAGLIYLAPQCLWLLYDLLRA